MVSQNKKEPLIRTIETRIESRENLDLIEKLLQVYAHFRARLWLDLVERKLNPNEQKRSCIKAGLSGRTFNSLKYDVQGVEKSLKELKAINIEEINGRIHSEERILKDKKRVAAQLKNEISLLLKHKENIKKWKARKYAAITSGDKPPGKRPKIPKSLIHKDLNQLKADFAKKQFIIDGFVIPLNFQNKSSSQSEAILSDAVATIVNYAGKRAKPLVIEQLDFRTKKQRLKEYPKSYRRMLSSFIYQRFYEITSSRCNKDRVEMIIVNPAFSSLIGAYKYQGLNISSHLKAALILARRGLRFGEKNRIYHVTPKGRAGRLYFPNDVSGHVWRFYSKIKVNIRRNLMGQQPNLERFLSQDDFIRRRPSLENSLAFGNKIYVNEDGKMFVTLGAGRGRQISRRLLESKPF